MSRLMKYALLGLGIAILGVALHLLKGVSPIELLVWRTLGVYGYEIAMFWLMGVFGVVLGRWLLP